MKNRVIILIGCLIVVVIIFSFSFHKSKNVVVAKTSDEIIKESNDNKSDDVKVKVDIKGAIKKPGVYEVDNNKRVIDVINIAGGLNKNANTNYINLSSKVKDEMVIWIYTSKEIEQFKLMLDNFGNDLNVLNTNYQQLLDCK